MLFWSTINIINVHFTDCVRSLSVWVCLRVCLCVFNLETPPCAMCPPVRPRPCLLPPSFSMLWMWISTTSSILLRPSSDQGRTMSRRVSVSSDWQWGRRSFRNKLHTCAKNGWAQPARRGFTVMMTINEAFNEFLIGRLAHFKANLCMIFFGLFSSKNSSMLAFTRSRLRIK